MATTFYLLDGGAGVAGYDAAKFLSGASVQTSTFAAVGSGTDVAWTKTSGGSVLAWATPPLSAAVTISGSVTFNWWARELNGTANVGLRAKLFRLQPNGTKTQFGTIDIGTELPLTTYTVQNWSGTPTSQAFSIGDRIVIEPWATNAGGTMGSGQTCNIQYNGGTAGVSGDSYVTFTETILVGRARLFT